jgi:hypothetical protein
MEAQMDTSPLIIDQSLSIHGTSMTLNGKTVSLNDVTGIKYGYVSIRLDMFSIGGRYMVELQTPQEKVRLNFRYYFRVNKERQLKKFNVVLDVLWGAVVVPLVNEMIDFIETGRTITIDQCSVTAQGIVCRGFLIAWNDLSYQKNYNRLTVNSKSNAGVWTNLYYTEIYNVHVLSSFLDWKFKAGN